MELDLQSLFGLHVHSCTHWLRSSRPPPFPPHLGSYTRALLVSQDRLLWSPGFHYTSMLHFDFFPVPAGTVLARSFRVINPEPNTCIFKGTKEQCMQDKNAATLLFIKECALPLSLVQVPPVWEAICPGVGTLHSSQGKIKSLFVFFISLVNSIGRSWHEFTANKRRKDGGLFWAKE